MAKHHAYHDQAIICVCLSAKRAKKCNNIRGHIKTEKRDWLRRVEQFFPQVGQYSAVFSLAKDGWMDGWMM